MTGDPCPLRRCSRRFRSDKLGVIANLLKKADGALYRRRHAFTFLAAQGLLGSRSSPTVIDTVKGYIAEAAERGVDLVLPVDAVVAPSSRLMRPRRQGRRHSRRSDGS